MEAVRNEVQKQWAGLLSDPGGPRHYLDSRCHHMLLRDLREIYETYPSRQGLLRLAFNESLLEMERTWRTS